VSAVIDRIVADLALETVDAGAAAFADELHHRLRTIKWHGFMNWENALRSPTISAEIVGKAGLPASLDRGDKDDDSGGYQGQASPISGWPEKAEPLTFRLQSRL